MTNLETLRPNLHVSRLSALVSDCLGIRLTDVDPRVPLVRYGLDSLNAVQLTAAIAAELEQEVPESLLLEHPDVDSLATFMRAAENGGAPSAGRAEASSFDRMLADSLLPAELQPEMPRSGVKTASRGADEVILLTGATGFLGGYLVKALLRDTQAQLVCLVRPREGDLLGRVRNNLTRFGIWETGFERRLTAVAADLQQPLLGLSAHEFLELAEQVDEIYHCGADVNWVQPYASLRDVNVLGTRELLRLACRRRTKPFHFVSSLATCYSTTGHSVINEDDETLRHIRGLHLGYAQSKCVAETLVRRASERGLPATIHRPTLIFGSSQTGVSSEDDFLPKLIRGCVAMGVAPDLNWVFDCCPVDYVADAIVSLSRRSDQHLGVYHLANPTTRHWRELVLWMNLYGYPIRLVSHRAWLAQLRTAAATPNHPLYPLRSFFLHRPLGTDRETLPELYEEQRRSRVSRSATEKALSKLGNAEPTPSLECPTLDARLLDRCFSSFVKRGVLPAASRSQTGPAANLLNGEFFQSILRAHYRDDSLTLERHEELPDSWQDSITNEMTSWRRGAVVGLSRHRVFLRTRDRCDPEMLDLFVKIKAPDRDVQDVAEAVAATCGEQLGNAFGRHKEHLGVNGAAAREAAIYRHADERLRKHHPRLFGAVHDESRDEWTLVLETLTDVSLMDSASDIQGWRPEHIEAVVRGIAEVHAIWYEREGNLLSQAWLGPTLTAERAAGMQDLWEALAEYAWKYFAEWIGPEMRGRAGRLIADVGQWRRAMEELPRTLIHNDFNPRNLALRRNQEAFRLCAFDWELATIGIPQRDLAEFLCFVLPPDCSRDQILHYIELHRRALSENVGRRIAPDAWRMGFCLALDDLILHRLPMYCMMHAFRPQPFLPRVLRTWRRLVERVEIAS